MLRDGSGTRPALSSTFKLHYTPALAKVSRGIPVAEFGDSKIHPERKHDGRLPELG